ncbi:hypothetical protein AAC387_Pa01g0303 [Persea americana]
MVGAGIFSRLSSYKIFHPSPLNKKELLIPKGDEVADTGDDLVMEFNVEFKPIDHPLEPLDEDRPVKCPLQNSSVLNNGEARMKRSASARISRKRPELRVLNEGAEVSTKPQVRAACKRHQTLPRNHSRPPLSRSRSISSGILQML